MAEAGSREVIFMKAIRTIISCTSPLLCEGIEVLLKKEQDIEIIGKIEDGSQTVKSLDLRPDVMILDPLLYRPEELSKVVHELKTNAHRTRILLFFSDVEMSDMSLMQYMMKGVDGYVKRTAKLTQLGEAIRTVHAGNIWAERKLLDKFVRYSPLLTTDLESKLAKLESPLTKREKEIITYLFLGLPNKRISHKLHISEKTVKTHLNNIFKKMKVNNRTQVICSLIYSH